MRKEILLISDNDKISLAYFEDTFIVEINSDPESGRGESICFSQSEFEEFISECKDILDDFKKQAADG